MPPRKRAMMKRTPRRVPRKTTGRKKMRKRMQRRPGHKISTSRTSPTFQSDRVHCKHIFVDDPYTGIISSTQGSTVRYRYAMNGLQDPNLGTATNQPSGYTLMQAQYGFYFVRGSKITVTVRRTLDTAQDSNNPYDIMVVPIPSAATTSPPAGYLQYRDQPYCKYKGGVSISADMGHTITSYMSIGKIEGLKDLYSPSYRANSANPSVVPEWHIILHNPSALSQVLPFDIEVKIVYYVEWFNRRAAPSSLVDKVLIAAQRSGLLDEVKQSLQGPPGMITEPEKKIKCKHLVDCKCPFIQSDPEDSDPDMEFDALPGRTPGKGAHHQPVIPEELPPKAGHHPGLVPGRAPTPRRVSSLK